MLIKKLLFFTLFILFAFRQSFGQEMRCLTPENVDTQIFENWLADMKSARSIQRLALETYNVPVIVHIIHDGETIGSGSNISMEQVISQFVVLNDDFNRTNDDAVNTPAEFLSVAGSMDISYVPAVEDPLGQSMAEPGINRINRNSAGFTDPPHSSSYIDAIIKPATIWDPDKYFNVWVMDFEEALGYAQPPASIDPGADPNTDGIVVRHSAFGTIGTVEIPTDGGRVTTHETGHWLGLYHIWGQSPDDACSEDDFVSDTPNQDKPSIGCPTSQGPTCVGVVREMWENYMDYSRDECMNLFTVGQVDRMTLVIENDIRREPLLISTVGGKFEQEITFTSLTDVQFGDSDFLLSATSDSGLPVSYISSNQSIATISESTVSIVGAGTTIITASQTGDNLFNEASSVEQLLTVNKADQIITFESIPVKTYGDPNFTLRADSDVGLPVITFLTSDPTIILLSDSTASITGTGEVDLVAVQAGDINYNQDSDTVTLIVQKADQNWVISGVQDYQDSLSNITLVIETDTELHVDFIVDPPILIFDNGWEVIGYGKAQISANQQGDEFYNPTDTAVSICILPSPVIYEDTLENEDYDQILWTDYSGVTWIFPDLTIVQSDTITVNDKGIYSVEIQTEGCATVIADYDISEIVGINELFPNLNIILYPNPASTSLIMDFKGELPTTGSYSIIDVKGRPVFKRADLDFPQQKVDINHLESGVYFIHILTEQKSFSLRFVKE